MVETILGGFGDDGAGFGVVESWRRNVNIAICDILPTWKQGRVFGPVEEVFGGGEAELGGGVVEGGVGEVEGRVDADYARVW